jgi:hypothetical protein
MAISYLKNAVNNNVVVHSDATGSIVLTGNAAVSNIAMPGEIVIGTTIKQVWFGSISGASGYWLVSKGNSTVNTVIGMYDSTAWIDYAGNGCALNISEAGENLYFTLTGAAGYIMFDIKKVTGP